MAFRDEIDINILDQKQKDLINMIDEKLAEWLDDVKKWRIISMNQLLENFEKKFNKKNIISNNLKKMSYSIKFPKYQK